ncbi:hypothetical protein H310_08710 [Aphanomyces invadans]|uniref:Polycystin cation channel PKD1/PKD2 domain-containing protein n=1 Tax=Aphanomyces invadans TaxID=157072 RepID=A0A024TX78_9STRA|nr:hypothetical protein H310_08710 [Aphanomyces invadans]ETV98589.1 hypothetical protein H310_08710 [Aphanomyces invadans]|eukprot:XP_008872786.1 hypothetical protein H310_08710 [Aphanomyces invadans]
MPGLSTLDMSVRTHPEAMTTIPRATFLRPRSPTCSDPSTLAHRASRMVKRPSRPGSGSSHHVGATSDARRLTSKVSYYSTMRIHVKRVQYALEEEKRTSFYKELAVYLVFLFIMLVTVCELRVQVPFEHNDGLDQVYFSQQFPNQMSPKTIHDVNNVDDIWDWFQGVLVPGYYNTTQRNSFRVSSVQVRFSRVQGRPCRTVTALVALFPAQTCYPAFEHGSQDTAPYGDDGFGHPFAYETGLRPLRRSLQYTPNLWNFRMDYGTGGYTVYLPRDDAAVGVAMVDAMAETVVLPSTRYIAATWVLYNPSTDVVSQLHALFEISATDRVQMSYRVSSFELRDIHSIDALALDTQSLLMVFLAVVTLGFSYREVQSIGDGGVRSYSKSVWNYFEVIQIGCLYGLVVAWFLYVVECHHIVPTLQRMVQDTSCTAPTSGRDCFVELTSLADLVDTIHNVGATLALVSAAIVFKYLRLNTRLNMLWETLRLAAKDLVAFVFIFMFVFFGYAIMGFLLFGTHSPDYRSLSDSLTACFQMLLGDFNYASLSAANPAMSGLFFFSFMILVFLIVVNMFVAILSEYYTLAQAAKRETDAKKKMLLHATTDDDQVVEYDVFKQVVSFVRDLRWRVKFSRTEPVPVVGNSCVLVVDYAYLMAERARLRTNFRMAILVVRTCIRWFPRPFDRPSDGNPRLASVGIHPGLPPKARPTRHLNYTKFPVTYVPLHSKSAVAATMIDQLEPGMVLDLDDGSLTCDRICLEVLGPQELYLTHDANDTDDMDPNERRPPSRAHFGLHHVHPTLGSGNHIKCCRVRYQGEIILAGHESCVVSRRVWVKYLVARLWRVVASVFKSSWWRLRCTSSSPLVAKRKRLISDDDLAMLLRAHMTKDESLSCRFDELVRQFRLFLAKKARQGAVRIPSHDLETCVLHEAIAFVERFPKALLPLDKRELVGYKYVPSPTDTATIRLPNSIARLSEFLAQNAHEVWSESRIAQGWKWGPHRDNDKKLHPDLLAYNQLTDHAKQFDRESSIETLKVIQALGYVIHPKGSSSQHPTAAAAGTAVPCNDAGTTTQVWDVEFGMPAPPGDTYTPKPIATADVHLSGELQSLVELLAENSHDLWAKKRMEEGWVYGPKRNDATKEHDGLVPYVYLTAEEKDMDRNSAVQTVKCILRCGFTFQHKRTNAKFRMFGAPQKASNPDLSTTVPNISGGKDTAVQGPVPSTKALVLMPPTHTHPAAHDPSLHVPNQLCIRIAP